MAVLRRGEITIGNQLDARVQFRLDQTGALFDPDEILDVTILESDATTVIETVLGASATRLSLGIYQVITAVITGSPRTILDRWRFRRISAGAIFTSTEDTRVAAPGVPGAGPPPPDAIVVTVGTGAERLNLTAAFFRALSTPRNPYYRGDVLVLDFAFTIDGTTPLDITGYTLRFSIKRSAGDPDDAAIILKSSLPTEGFVITDAPGGLATLTIASSDGDVFPEIPGTLFEFDLQTTDAGSVVSTILRGVFEVLQDVTLTAP